MLPVYCSSYVYYSKVIYNLGDLAEHLNVFRQKITKSASRHIPVIAYSFYNKKRVEVSLTEGWDEIKMIEFIPEFADDYAKMRFFEYT
jgi:hypothetical protein